MALIHLISVGSRGDLEPYLALLLELQRRGHTVKLIGSPNFADAARHAAIGFEPLPGDFRDLLASPAGLALMQGKPVRLVTDALLLEWLTTAREAIRGCELLLVPPLALWAYHLAEAEGCRFAVLSPFPVVATATFPFLKFPARQLPPGRVQRRLNRLSYLAFRLLKWRQESRLIQAFRSQQLGLPRLPWSGAAARRDPPPRLTTPPILHLFSRHVLERPADWPNHAQVTGYCLNPTSPAESYSPPPDLERFLEAGPPPFYAGFGSMIPRDPEGLGPGVALWRPAPHGVCAGGVPPRLAVSPDAGRRASRRSGHHGRHAAQWNPLHGGGVLRRPAGLGPNPGATRCQSGHPSPQHAHGPSPGGVPADHGRDPQLPLQGRAAARSAGCRERPRHGGGCP